MSKNTPKLPPVGPDPQEPGGEPRPSRQQSKADRRAAAAAALAEQKRKARRRNVLIQVGVGAVVVAIVIAVTAVVLSRGDDAPTSGATAPPGLTSDGGIRFGAADAPVTVQAVEDFQCPICREFEKTNADLLSSYRDGTDVAVEYRPIAFLDRMSSTEYSSRALNASACVLEASGKDAWLTFHQELYDNQPPEQSAGLPDSDLVDMAAQAGASGSSVESCIDDRKYADWVEQTTNKAFADGVQGTPTIFVNGKKLDSFDADTITKAVEAAGAS